MKTKITAVAVVLAVALAVTAVAASLSGSTRTIPIPKEGDPVPGVDISIEQTPGGITKGPATNGDGISSITVYPGRVVATFKLIGNPIGGGSLVVMGSSTGGGKSVSGTWSDTKQPFKMEMDVKGNGRQKATVKVKHRK